MTSFPPYKFRIPLPPDEIQNVCDNVKAFGDDWVSGWDGEGRCVWCKDVVTATKIVLLIGTLMEQLD
jgi:hypothetical protein